MRNLNAIWETLLENLAIDRLEADIARRRGGVTWLLVRLCAAGNLALGGIVMLGWLIHSAAIVQILPGYSPMQFNTAGGFFLLGLGLLSVSWGATLLTRFCGAGVFAIAGLTLFQDLTGTSLGIDQALVTAFIADASAAPGRMAPNTSVAFLLASAYLALATFPVGLTLPRSLLLVIGPAIIGLSSLSIVGYATGLEALFRWIPETTMALHTAMGFLVFGIGASLKAWRLEAQRAKSRSFSVVAPVIVGAVTALFGIWIALRHYESARLSALAGLYPDLARSIIPEVVFGAGLVLTVIMGLTAHFAHAAFEAGQLRKMNRELRTLNAELDRFAYAASHDLKAPLRGVGLLASWIHQELKPDVPEKVELYLGQIQDRLKRLEGLLESLLAYAQINQSPSAPARFDIGSALREIVELANLRAGMRVKVDSRPGEIHAERGLFDIVFINLISNAAKHHDRAEGEIDIRVCEGDASFRIEVADDGPGIAPRYHLRIFEMFQTLKARDEVEASGMGLALVQKALQRAGAVVHLVSDPQSGRGARFIIDWPKGLPDGYRKQHRG
jgi:signal transduction histidine kinase